MRSFTFLRPALAACAAWVLACAASPAGLSAQGRYVEVAARHLQPVLYHEALALPAGGQPVLVVSFRLPNDLLVFVRDRQQAAERGFVASPELTVELSQNGRTVEARSWKATHTAATFEETQDRLRDVEGSVALPLAPGSYSYRITFTDPNADRVVGTRPRRVEVPDFTRGGVGGGFLARQVEEDSAGLRIRLANLGGDAPFGEPALLVLPVAPGPGPGGAPALPLALRRLGAVEAERVTRREKPERVRDVTFLAEERIGETGEARGTLVRADTLAHARLVPIRAFEPDGAGAGRLLLRRAARPEEAVAYLAVVDLDGERLEDGVYVADASLGAEGPGALSHTAFRTHWRQMPFSLYDLDLAIRNLSFLEDRSTVRQMLRGSREEREARFRRYWQERDPTPGTVFNEIMAEYYRRIDHAAFAYRTGAEPIPDGLQTDRARIYVLYGPPLSVRRTFPETGGGVQEIWEYRGGKTFVFHAASSLDAFSLVNG